MEVNHIDKQQIMQVKEAAERLPSLASQTGRKAKILTGIEDDKRQQITKAHNNGIKVGELEFNTLILSQSWCNIHKHTHIRLQAADLYLLSSA